RPPRSTLLPYTTLFRSSCASAVRFTRNFDSEPPSSQLSIDPYFRLDRLCDFCTAHRLRAVSHTFHNDDGRIDDYRWGSAVLYIRSEEHTSELQSRENLV